MTLPTAKLGRTGLQAAQNNAAGPDDLRLCLRVLLLGPDISRVVRARRRAENTPVTTGWRR